jgi:single-stranded-DNA-specific exonuclease
MGYDEVEEPNLMHYLDLVALGTVCDVMTLQGINRAFVTQGLKVMAKRSNVGLTTLANMIKNNGVIQTHHLGYAFGPRINAGGRVGDGYLGSELLSTNNPERAYELAMQLEALNENRRVMESEALEEAYSYIEKNNKDNDPVIFAVGNNWHIGILGILASRIKEKYNRPCAVISLNNNVGKGSARSIPGINLGTAISAAKEEGILLEGGGHAMAGGFTIKSDNIELFYQFLAARLHKHEESYAKACEINIDAVLTTKAISEELIHNINKAAPFGNGNPQPRFVLLNVRIINTMITGKNHIVAIARDANQKSNTGNTIKCILFKGLNTEMGDILLNSNGNILNIAGTLQLNYYNNNKVDFVIDDVAIPHIVTQ